MARSRVEGARSTAVAIRKLARIGADVAAAAAIANKPIQEDAATNIAQYKPTRYQPGPNIVSGRLMRQIVVREIVRKAGLSVTAVGIRGKSVAWAHLVEFGTDPHWQPRRKIWHPGSQAFPFLTPAFQQNVRAVQGIFAREMGRRIEALAHRVRAK